MSCDEVAVHLLYFIKERDEEIKKVWKRATELLGEGEEVKVLEEYSQLTLARSFASPLAELSLYLRGDVVVLQLLILAPEEDPGIAKRLKEVASEEMSLFLGETLLFISRDREKIARLYGDVSWRRSELTQGELYLLEKGDERDSYLLLSSLPRRDFFLRFIYIDLLGRKLSREADLFLEQLQAIRQRRKEFESRASQLLSEKCCSLEEFEGVIEKLSLIYIELAQYLEWISGKVTALREDIHDFESEVRRLLAGEDEIFSQSMKGFSYALDTLMYERENFILAQEKVKNAMDVVRMKISIERGKETVELQHESISLQVAAGFIEFIVVFYYTLNSWKILAGKAFAALSPGVILLTLAAFSSSVVLFTHAVAAARKENRRLTREMVASVALILVFAAAMFLLSVRSP
ncbi:MAG: hypothetical protein GXO66_06320 [Euryarchaeota archaeon]|nr:hypothetical protein [Euryarchaeota archaeon]